MCPINQLAILQLAGALAIGGAIVYFALRARNRRLALLKALEGPLNGRAEGNLLEMFFRGSFSGLPAEIRFVAGGENDEDSEIKYSLLRPAPYRLLVARRGAMARLTAFFTGLKEVPGLDPAWTEGHYAASDNPQAAHRFAADPAARAALERLFELGYSRFRAEPDKVQIYKYFRSDEEELKPELVLRTFGLLHAAAVRLL